MNEFEDKFKFVCEKTGLKAYTNITCINKYAASNLKKGDKGFSITRRNMYQDIFRCRDCEQGRKIFEEGRENYDPEEIKKKAAAERLIEKRTRRNIAEKKRRESKKILEEVENLIEQRESKMVADRHEAPGEPPNITEGLVESITDSITEDCEVMLLVQGESNRWLNYSREALDIAVRSHEVGSGAKIIVVSVLRTLKVEEEITYSLVEVDD